MNAAKEAIKLIRLQEKIELKGKNNMTVRSITFPDNLYKKLEQSAEEKYISIASLIKLACSEYLQRERSNDNNPRYMP